MAPEYAVLGHLSVKIDVYRFGVLVLEIVTGRKNTDAFEESSAGESGTLLNYVSTTLVRKKKKTMQALPEIIHACRVHEYL